MYFDALTLAAVTDELRSQIIGGRVQRVLLLSDLAVGLEIYARGRRLQLLASAHPQFARVHLVRHKLSRGVEQATPLLLLLRKYVLGGRIVAVEQPALERVMLLSIVKEPELGNREIADEDLGGEPPTVDGGPWTVDGESEAAGDEGEDGTLLLEEVASQREPSTVRRSPSAAELLRCDLIFEPQDRRSNIILVDDNNLVLESVKRVTSRMSRRVVLPRRVYELPPPLERRDPRQATGNGIMTLREGKERDLARAIVATYRAVSPQIAREAIFRAIGHPSADLAEDLPWYSVAARLRELYSGEWAASLASGPEGLIAYAPYALTHLPDAAPQPSISAAIETFYAGREELTGHHKRRDAVAQAIGVGHERLRRQRDQIAGELHKAQDLERLRWEGEMIFAFLHDLRPGQSNLEVEGRPIALDPGRPAVDQAQERFRAYDKAKSALAGLPERLAATETQIAGVDQLLAMLALTDERDQIDQIAQEADELGYLRGRSDGPQRKPRQPKIKPLHLVSSEGFDLYVGRSARQNEDVTFRIGRVDDLWVHVRTIHGAHVIVRSSGREVPEQTLQEAAGLAAYFSQARADAAVEVDLARRSLVRKIPGGPPGLVSYRAERTLRVAPLPPWKADGETRRRGEGETF